MHLPAWLNQTRQMCALMMAVWGGFIALALSNGKVDGIGGVFSSYSREKQPVNFWAGVAFMGAIVVACAVGLVIG